MPNVHPIILSGGVGSRLWPLSRSLFPKQLLALVGEHTLIQDTALRTTTSGFAKPSIVCHVEHRFLVAEQLRAVGIDPENIFLEPFGRNTAPAAAIAALAIGQKYPDAVLLLMPADHVIHDQTALREAITIARDVAQGGHLVTFGIQPRGPDTGYGYIQRGAPLHDGGQAFTAFRFVEKPDAKTAARYVQAGDYYWNSGMFMFRAATYISELERLEPELLDCCRKAISGGQQDLDFVRLDPKAFEACKSISIDYAVMERTDRAAIVPVEMGWSDIGSWEALWDVSEKDAGGNVVKGDVLHLDVRGSYLRSEGPLIAALGVRDLVVVASPDAVLVCPKSATQHIKGIVERLDHDKRDLHVTHRKIHRVWGSCERIDQGENFQVNRIIINPGAAMPLRPRDRHVDRWVLVTGTARILRDAESVLLKENEPYAAIGPDRQLENAGSILVQIIEIRIGGPFV